MKSVAALERNDNVATVRPRFRLQLRRGSFLTLAGVARARQNELPLNRKACGHPDASPVLHSTKIGVMLTMVSSHFFPNGHSTRPG
jgi:hypothetical protein